MPRVYPPIEGRQTNSNIPPSVVESFAGFTAGIISTLAVHPFDVVKTRLQSQYSQRSRKYEVTNNLALVSPIARARWGDSLRVVKDIAKNEGSYGALYRGLMPNMIGNSVSWALYFLWYAITVRERRDAH